jgi:hypothetical protein
MGQRGEGGNVNRVGGLFYRAGGGLVRPSAPFLCEERLNPRPALVLAHKSEA